MSSVTPSPSLSLGSGQPLASTFSPFGVSGHLSASSSTPSPSLSLGSGQPVASTGSPRGVSGHRSRSSVTPSLSPSPGPPPNRPLKPNCTP